MTQKRVDSYPQPDRWSYLWLIIGTVLTVFMYGNWPLSLAAWLAPLFLIRFMRTQKLLRGFILIVLGLSVANTIAWQGAGPGIIPTPIFGAFLGLAIGLIFLVDRVLVPRLPAHGLASFVATLVFPLLVAAQEFLFMTSNVNIYGSNGSWAYTQHSNPILMQLVSITGLWGLTFLTSWFASVVNWAWERSFSWSETWRGVAIYGGILVLVLAFGNIRLRFFTPQTGTVRVHGFTAGDVTQDELSSELVPLAESDTEAFRRRTASINEQYIEGTIREARAGAQIVVWPEAAAVTLGEDTDALLARGQQVAQEETIYLAIGLMELGPDGDFAPRLVVVDPSGEIVINYLKYAYGQGTPLNEVDLQTVDTPYGRLSGVLCGDLEFPSKVNQAGRKGVDILLVPSWDSAEEAPWHFRLAPFRAVENGFSLFRPTNQGVSLATDPYGRVLAHMDHFAADDRVMIAQVPTHRVPTIYAAVGDLFGWLTVVGFLVIAGWAVIRGRKAKRAEAGSPEAQVTA